MIGVSIRNNTAPLCLLPSGKLICYRYGKLLIVLDGKVIKSHQLFTSKKETILGRCRILFRLLRLGIRTAIALDEEHILLSIGNMIYEFDLTSGKLSQGYSCGEGVRPLVFSDVKGIEGIDDGIYFGTYQSVSSKNPVHIFKRTGVDRWETVHTFELGSVEHIHNVIPDPYRKCLWIFSGDFGDNAAIWKVTENFGKVERAFYGDQKYRACVVHALPEGLLYATDSPVDKDYIFLLNPESGELKEIMPIAGSCIYGCKWKDRYVFESSVEPSGKYSSRLDFLLSRKIGPGIQDRYVRIYCGNLDNGFREIYKEKKDCLPYATFQFGAVKFPSGKNDSDTLWFQPVAVRKGDLQLSAMKME